MQIRKATINDIDLLVKLRLDYLLAENKAQGFEDIETIRSKIFEYLERWIPSERFIAFIAENNGEIYSTAFLSIVERPPRSAFSSYRVGTVYNVFTYTQHRKKGIVSELLFL